MGSNVLDTRSCTDPIEDSNHANKMSVAPIGWKDEWQVISLGLPQQEVDSHAANDPNLLTGFAIGKTNALLLHVNPCSVHAKHLHLPKSGQQHDPNGGKASRMLALLLHRGHSRAQPASSS